MAAVLLSPLMADLGVPPIEPAALPLIRSGAMTGDPASRSASKPPAVDAKARSRKRTAEAIQRAIAQPQGGQGKGSLSAVAKRAGATPALLHHTDPDRAEPSRGLVGQTTRARRDAKQEALVREQDINRGLRRERTRRKVDLAQLASVNPTRLSELAVLKGLTSGKVVSLLQSQPMAG